MVFIILHPIVKGCIGNDIFMSESQNLIFLTDANMAGKSTLMKSLGISFIYGIADDRHGMRIINNEKIIDIIRKSI